jgi:hypothetical protein
MFDYAQVDWEMLRKQKRHLLQVTTFFEHTPYSKQDRQWADSLDGLVYLIDYVQDEAVNSGEYTEEEVFGKKDADGYYIMEE